MGYRKVLICGDRNWGKDDDLDDEVLISNLISDYDKNIAIIEGGAAGADRIAGDYADLCGLPHIKVPANWNFYKKAAGPLRNLWMLDILKPDLVIGFHRSIDTSKGTKHCLAEAEKRGIEVILIDGT